jgi:hypothetical protein
MAILDPILHHSTTINIQSKSERERGKGGSKGRREK